MEYVNTDLLVEPQWLFDNLDDKNLVIVDCDIYNQNAYARAHIPNAVKQPRHHWIKSENEDGTPKQYLPTLEEYTDLMAKLGINNDSLIVLYDAWGSPFAIRLWWVMRYYGFSNAKILNGGWQNWVANGFPISLKSSTIKDSQKIQTKEQVSRRVTLTELMENYNRPQWQIIDVRSDDEYNGKDPSGNKRSGHIPGSIHLEWNRFLNNSKEIESVRIFRPASEIRMLLDSAGISTDNTIVTYCQAAVRASFSAFVFELMGISDVRVYDESMSEWANEADMYQLES